MAIAYLSNRFPEASEPYVWEEVEEVRRRGCEVICCSFRKPPRMRPELAVWQPGAVYVLPPSTFEAVAAMALLLRNFALVADLVWRVLRGPEKFRQRSRTLVHTWLGACLALRLRGRQVTHIHVHHGYFSSWAGIVAARMLRATFSMTLHGSDLLLHAAYTQTKLADCLFCVTVSEFNRRYILNHYPGIDHRKITVHRIGVDVNFWFPLPPEAHDGFSILSVGRLHPVKNHGFLLLACRELKNRNVTFRCAIAGEGPERKNLENLISALDLSEEVRLLGNVSRSQLRSMYAEADAVVLTSHSEGIPLTLMEAMAVERIVVAPAITGIPELVVHGRTGFLYQPNSLHDFLQKLAVVRVARGALDPMRHAARAHVERNYNRTTTLGRLIDDLLSRTSPASGQAVTFTDYENTVLQQVQLPLQRDRDLSARNNEVDALARP